MQSVLFPWVGTSGAHWLLRTQQPAGDWLEPDTTGTGFPGVFYLRYDSYRINWPLLALAEVRKLLSLK